MSRISQRPAKEAKEVNPEESQSQSLLAEEEVGREGLGPGELQGAPDKNLSLSDMFKETPGKRGRSICGGRRSKPGSSVKRAARNDTSIQHSRMMLQGSPKRFVGSFRFFQPVDKVFGDLIVDGKLDKVSRQKRVLAALQQADVMRRWKRSSTPSHVIHRQRSVDVV